MKEVWRSAAYFVGAVDLTSQTNRLDFEASVEEKECTTFGSGGAREYVGGLEMASISGGGYVDYGGAYDVDRQVYNDRRLLLPHTIGPSNAGSAVAATAYVVKSLTTSLKVFTQVGEVLPWEISASGSSRSGRGKFLVSPVSAITSSTNGTAVEIGAVPSGHSALATLHCLARSGTATLDVELESDEDADFDGSETTRIVFDQVSGVGAQFKSAAGPITDTHWRAAMTVSGSGSLTVVIAVGVSLFAV